LFFHSVTQVKQMTETENRHTTRKTETVPVKVGTKFTLPATYLLKHSIPYRVKWV